MAISAVLLSYKEEENLKLLLPKIRSNLEKTNEEFEIIVIDTAKPLDNTRIVCEENGANYFNQKYPGFGGAFKTGIEVANNDKFLILDSDGSHNPKYITKIHKKFLTGADVVIGSRYVNGGKTFDKNISIIMSKVLNTVFRIALGIKAKDISTDYRMYDTKQLKRVNLECVNYDVLQEVLLKLKINNPKLVIKEIPISFNKRIYGESKRKLIPFIVSYIKTLFRLIKIRVCCFLKKKI